MYAFNIDLAYEFAPSECGFYARCDYKDPTVIVRRADDSAKSRFRYVNHEINDGTAILPIMPHAHTRGETLSITLKDDFSSIILKLNYTVLDDSNVLARNMEITNEDKEEAVLTKAFSFALDLPAGTYDTMCLVGFWRLVVAYQICLFITTQKDALSSLFAL